MAFPMVHLLVAREWAKDKPDLYHCPEYYLGSLSPDAIHARKDIRYPEDKFETHLGVYRNYDAGPVCAYWAERGSPFDKGYGVHVLTDMLWVSFYAATYPTLVVQGSTDRDRYYPDVHRIDDWLYSQCAERDLLLDYLRGAGAPMDHPLLTLAEIDEWRNRVVASFDRELDLGNPAIIRLADVRRFIDAAPRSMDALHSGALRIHGLNEKI